MHYSFPESENVCVCVRVCVCMYLACVCIRNSSLGLRSRRHGLCTVGYAKYKNCNFTLLDWDKGNAARSTIMKPSALLFISSWPRHRQTGDWLLIVFSREVCRFKAVLFSLCYTEQCEWLGKDDDQFRATQAPHTFVWLVSSLAKAPFQLMLMPCTSH